MSNGAKLPPYRKSLAGSLLSAREAMMRPIRPLLREAGVTEQQWRVLRVLDGEGDQDVTGLAEAAILFPPSLTRIIRDLGDRGLIVRKQDPVDGRKWIVSITNEGLALVRQTSAQTSRELAAFKQKFGADRLDELIAALREFQKAIE